MSDYDLIIMGAGPTGMAAANLAAKYQCKTLILDEQSKVGGQIYRAIETMGPRNRNELGKSYQKGQFLADSFRRIIEQPNITYVPNSTVWQLDKNKEVGYSHNGAAKIVTAKQVIVATGAQERAFPVLGWNLSGVMTIGAAQILLKESESVIQDAVFVGSGPLFYLVIHQYLSAGVPIKAILDLTPKENYLKSLKHLPKALSKVSQIVEGWQWKKEAKGSKVQYEEGIEDLKIIGEDKVTSIEYKQGSEWKSINTKMVLLHQGVVPNINISLAAGCDYSWSEPQSCWTIDVDDWFQSSVEGISVAGDGASIVGGIASETQGSVAALGALQELNKVTNTECNELVKPLRKKLNEEMKLRPFLHALFKPAKQFRIPQREEIIVCRCEEVTAGQIREVVENGCCGPNQLKSYSRCGMGPCQGRFCGLTVSEIIAEALKKPISEIGYYRLRPPIKPLLLRELANLENSSKQS